MTKQEMKDRIINEIDYMYYEAASCTEEDFSDSYGTLKLENEEEAAVYRALVTSAFNCLRNWAIKDD